MHAWGRILQGRFPTLSIEITRECPLHCPGCYAYEDGHLGGGANLRQLSDFKGETLIEGVLALVRRYRPLHLSIVGGDPLVRFREMEVLLPRLKRWSRLVRQAIIEPTAPLWAISIPASSIGPGMPRRANSCESSIWWTSPGIRRIGCSRARRGRPSTVLVG